MEIVQVRTCRSERLKGDKGEGGSLANFVVYYLRPL